MPGTDVFITLLLFLQMGNELLYALRDLGEFYRYEYELLPLNNFVRNALIPTSDRLINSFMDIIFISA